MKIYKKRDGAQKLQLSMYIYEEWELTREKYRFISKKITTELGAILIDEDIVEDGIYSRFKIGNAEFTLNYQCYIGAYISTKNEEAAEYFATLDLWQFSPEIPSDERVEMHTLYDVGSVSMINVWGKELQLPLHATQYAITRNKVIALHKYEDIQSRYPEKNPARNIWCYDLAGNILWEIAESKRYIDESKINRKGYTSLNYSRYRDRFKVLVGSDYKLDPNTGEISDVLPEMFTLNQEMVSWISKIYQ